MTFAGCAVSSGVGNGTFIIGNVPPGDYVIEITACTGNNGCAPSAGDFAQQVFTVTSGASIVLIPSKGPTGTHVIVNGTGFLPSDKTCTITSPGSNILVNAACSIVAPINGKPSNKTTGSFYVGNVPIGQYVIRVTGSPGLDFAEAVFNVTRGPQLILIPSKGPTGVHVGIEGGFFLTSDTTCSISSPSSGSIIQGAGCAVTVGSGFGAGFGNNVTGSFVVGNVPEGQYVIQVTGNQGDFAQAVFNVTRGAFIQLFPAKGPTGTHVNVEGSYFLSTDTTCSISSPSSGSIIQGAACTTFKVSSGPFLGFMNVTGSFIVGNVNPGQYVIQVTGNHGDFAQAIFNVTSGAFIQLSGINGQFASVGQAAKGPVGTHVNIEGSYFLSTDTTCSISSPSSGSIILGAACSVFVPSSGPFLGFKNVTGSFVVGNVPEGQYVIQVTGNQGDFAQAVFNVTRGAFIQLFPAKGPTGTHVNVEGSYFLSTDTTCSISSPSSGSILQGAACSVFKASSGPFLGFMNVTGSFIVGNVAEGQYVIQVSGNQGDFAQAVFNVTAGAFIQLSGLNGGFVRVGQVASGPTGTHVNIEGSSFLPNDALNSAACSVSSPSSGNVIAPGSQACSFFKAPNGFVNVTGSFIVGNVAEGQYVIRVSGGAGDSAQAVFNVTAGAFIQLSGLNGGFVSLGQVASGPTGTHVNVEGSSFLPGDAFNSATCSISSPSGNVIASGSQACSFFKAPNGFVNVTGSFIVGNVNPGQYVIRVSGGAGDSAAAVFNVTRGPFIQLSAGPPGGFVSLGQVASGPIGTHVAVEGSNFLISDTTCTLSSPSGGVIIGAACSTFTAPNGFKNVTGSFTIGNVLPGQYVIQVSGNQGDFAQSVFNVTVGAKISLSPASGRIGTHVLVNGTGFLPTDGTCTISSPGNIILGGTAACSIQLGTGRPGGSFTVGNVAPGQYVIQVSGNQGDFAQAVFNVTVGPKITLSPGTGPIGVHVLVNGTGFLPTDTTCTITGPGSSIVTAAGCSLQAGTGAPGGSFTVSNVVPGQYVIQVTGNGGDFAQAVFNVTMGATITLTPGKGAPGANVNFTGSGFLPTDTSCVVSSPGSGAVMGGTQACAIRAGKGTVNGSFLIGNILPGQYLIQVTGNQGDFAQAVLIVVNGPRLSVKSRHWSYWGSYQRQWYRIPTHGHFMHTHKRIQ